MRRRNEVTVMAIDPGETVGWSIGEGHTILQYGSDWWTVFLDFLELAIASGVMTRVVSERVDPRRWDNEMKMTVGVAFTSQWLAERRDLDYSEVNAADKRKTMPDVEPHLHGHARDAEAIRLWDFRYGRW